jgi:hypothetical protein
METGIEKLFDDLVLAFCGSKKPRVNDLVNPLFLTESASARGVQARRLVEHVFGPMKWPDVDWDHFAWDEILQGPTAPAHYATASFEYLSNVGLSYFAPSIMQIVIAEGRLAEELLDWLVDRLDPESVGMDWVEEAFGRWNVTQVDVLVRFLEWALAPPRDQYYVGQDDRVLTFWKQKRTRLSSPWRSPPCPSLSRPSP